MTEVTADKIVHQITKDNIGKIEVPVTSIPSPFAQLHLFETAFEFINKEYRATQDVSVFTGKTTYHKYISQCLDIFEMLFEKLQCLPHTIRADQLRRVGWYRTSW